MAKEDNNPNTPQKPQKPISHADIPQPQSEYVQNGRDMDGVIKRKSQQ